MGWGEEVAMAGTQRLEIGGPLYYAFALESVLSIYLNWLPCRAVDLLRR